MRPKNITLLVLFICLSAACAQTPNARPKTTPSLSASPPPTLSVRGLPFADFEITRQQRRVVKLVVEVANTPAAQAVGLMGVRTLEPDRGMVFPQSAPSKGPFYMKNTLIPLDIAFWDQSGTIVDVLQMEPCEADPCHLYYSRAPYMGAVETNLNVLVGSGVAPGDSVSVIPR
jgi:uncharacterized membrane protein (UPF0127 family)